MSASASIVSAPNRDLQNSPFGSYIQTDAGINHGDFGGPLIDSNGDVIGIGFAILSSAASFVEHFLLHPSHPKPGWLGVTLQDTTQSLSLALATPGTSGAIISAVGPFGPAAAASLRIGDVLEQINDVPLGNSRAFNRAVVVIPVGQPAHLTIWRDGKQHEIAATVAAWLSYMPYGGMMHGGHGRGHDGNGVPTPA